ncbi:MAG: amino acid adenylation domain-containing protein [Candidatus Aminicenantes bacterium]|nr:amino acid adenylation domain-containing protein [Candidatus Aminicenantes bacterium]
MTIEKNKLKTLDEFNDTGADYPEDKTIHGLFEEQVERTPEHTAAVFGNRKLSYRQLNEKANRLARLLRSKGVGPDILVGIMVERSLEMVVGIYGILKAGGAYLPISTSNPVIRTVHLLKESGTKVLLTQGKFFAALEVVGEGIEIINLEDDGIYQGPASNLPVVNTSRDVVYVIYTSGSTGKPKGVAIEHRSVVNRLHWMQCKYPLTVGDMILQKTPFFFDVSVWEMFWWAMTGAGVCFLPPGGEKFPQFIVEAAAKNSVTVMHFVPSMMSVFLEYLRNSEEDVGRLDSLRRVFASGEKLTSSHVRAFNEILHVKNGTCLTNLYGPTEATVDVTYFDCPVSDLIETIPIGKPIDNTQLYILGEGNQINGVGEEGELSIGGVGVARGYLNNPEMTSQKFLGVQGPFFKKVPGRRRLYKTGDLARWMPDGNVDFLGRQDHQVKIHGLRIELGEIESVISGYPAVRENVVLVKQYGKNITMIVAYVVSKSNELFSVKELKLYLKERLPDYMTPTLFVALEQFPLTPSGKVDRNALPEPQFSNT